MPACAAADPVLPLCRLLPKKAAGEDEAEHPSGMYHTALWRGINKQRLAGTPGMAGLDGTLHYLPCSWEDSLKIGLTIRTNKKPEALRASSSHQLLPHLLNVTPPGMSQAKISQRNRLQKQHPITSTNERQL